jgi:hypothetical protein
LYNCHASFANETIDVAKELFSDFDVVIDAGGGPDGDLQLVTACNAPEYTDSPVLVYTHASDFLAHPRVTACVRPIPPAAQEPERELRVEVLQKSLLAKAMLTQVKSQEGVDCGLVLLLCLRWASDLNTGVCVYERVRVCDHKHLTINNRHQEGWMEDGCKGR